MLKFFKVIANAIVYSNLWISIGAVAFSCVSAVFLQVDLSVQFLLFIFSTTLFTYNFQRLVKLNFSQAQPISGERAIWVKEHLKIVYGTTIASAVTGVYFGWTYFVEFSWLIVLVGFFSFFYVWKLPFLKRNVRSIPGIKILVLSGTWVLATNILPYFLFSELPISQSSALIFFNSFLFISAISIPFDIRDLVVDDRKLRTLPQVLGVKVSIWLAILMLIVSVILVIYSTEKYQISLIINAVITSLIIYFSDRYKKELLYSGLVDGTLVFQGVLVLLFL